MALAELQRMTEERHQLEIKIAKQKKRIAALAELANSDEASPAPVGLVDGITDAVRTVFQGAEKPLNPAQVRDRAQALGVGRQQNLLASVHTVIRRLLEAGEIEPLGDLDVGGGYRWKTERALETALARFKQAHDSRQVREKSKRD